MNLLAYADAARPTPVSVLKLPLSRYSLGHELLLFRRRNALLVTDQADFSLLPQETQMSALREAIWICSDSFSVRDRFERPSLFQLRMRLNLLCRRIWVHKLRRLDMDDYALAHIDLRNYLAQSRDFPPEPGKFARQVLGYDKEENTGRSLGQPLVLTLYAFVLSLPADVRGHCAWDFPYAQALWLYLAKCESEGSYRIENDREFSIAEEERGHLRALEEEKRLLGEKNKPVESVVPPEKIVPIPGGLATAPPAELTKGDK